MLTVVSTTQVPEETRQSRYVTYHFTCETGALSFLLCMYVPTTHRQDHSARPGTSSRHKELHKCDARAAEYQRHVVRLLLSGHPERS